MFLALHVIGVQQGGICQPLQDEGEFPTEVMCIAQTAIHALSTEWGQLVRGIPQQEDAPFGEGSGEYGMKGVDGLANNVRVVCSAYLLDK